MADAIKAKKARKSTEPVDPDLDYAAKIPFLSEMEFLSDLSGEKKSVVIPLTNFRQLIHMYRALALTVINQGNDAEYVDFETVLAELKADGLLPA
jgi:hypothetical protein